MRRRDFLKRSAAAGATLLAAGRGPLLLGAADKAGSKRPVVGEGEYRYECIHGWGNLPSNPGAWRWSQ